MSRAGDVLEDRDSLYEIVNGERVEKAMGTYENVLAGNLYAALHGWLVNNPIGRATIEVMFDIPNRNHDLRPDVAFVSFDRWPQSRGIPRANAWPVVPDLAVEVVSPTDDMQDVFERVGTFFDIGVRAVWLVVPGRDIVFVHSALLDARLIGRGGALADDAVLPGFRLPVADLFPPPDATP
ncbi:MAG TPA: Uma2 family endonuclease [Gemmataceae bacterium]|nr:Uma2 family endonuclease [Gemmataceae bacterium]